jgi:hypothetical protein
MNQRIKQLALQAQKVIGHTDGGYTEIKVLDQEKFAELIVNECVRVMYDNAIERKVPPDIDKTPLQYAIAIKEHFGVEQ